MNLTEVNLAEIDWDFNEAWNWPLPVKIGTMTSIFVVIMSVGIYFDTIPQMQALEILQKKEIQLKTAFELKREESSNIIAYEEQISQMQKKLQTVIDQLPLAEEISGLLIDISKTGISSGLEFKLFKPAPSINKDFYSELPINIQVTGKYEDLIVFISKLATLPRIVTIHDLTIEPIDKTQASKLNPLLMSVVVKTYNENAKNTITK